VLGKLGTACRYMARNASNSRMNSTVLAVRFGNCQILNIQFRNHEVHSIFLRPCEQFVALFSFDPVLFRYCHERKDRRTAW